VAVDVSIALGNLVRSERARSRHTEALGGAGGVIYAPMAYDEDLANRLRELVLTEEGVAEKKMFGGLAFLVHGNMCVGVMGEELIARVAPARFDEVVARPGARPFAMGGRSMAGWVLVDGTQIAEPGALSAWIDEADQFVQTLPKK
jgi:hypothetical protein